MKKKSASTQQATLESRIEELEFNVARISETIYDLIDRLQGIPDPPCPPMCGFAEMGEQTAKKHASKKRRR